MFSHQIPLKLPKGATGMQPDLALVYSPGAANGLVGVGWSLSGLSSITRVNYGEGIKYGGSDTYAHSSLGILVRQSDGNYYRSKTESFSKVSPIGTCGDGPCSWVVTNRSGTKFHYGTTLDSRLQRSVGSPDVRTWAIASVEDLFGNSYEVSYDNDAANGRLYPALITYTKRSGIATYRTVEFSYEARADVESGFYQNALERTTKRLKWIQVKSGGSLVRKYRLDYEYGGATGRSVLVAIQEYGSNGNASACAAVPPPSSCALPAQTFEWQDASNGYATTFGTSDMNAGSRAVQWLTGDVNGDGKTDIIHAWEHSGWALGLSVYSSNGTGYAGTWGTYTWNGYAAVGWLTGDTNADGKTDLIQLWNNSGRLGLIVYTSNGAGLVQTWGSSDMGHGSGALAWLTGDVNGDGRTDIIQPWNNNGRLGLIVYTSNGTGFTQAWATGDTGYGSGALTWLTGDVNGDGRTDVIQPWNNNGRLGVTVYASDGAGYITAFHSGDMGEAVGTAFCALTVGDVNGDGNTDLIHAWGGYWEWSEGVIVYTSTGTGLTRTWKGGVGMAHAPRTGDVNGDGKTDLIWPVNNNGQVAPTVYTSNGTGYTQVWTSANTGQGATALAWLTGDTNGDGKTDLVQLWNNNNRLGLIAYGVMGLVPDLLTTINNGLGGTIEVSHVPAPQLSGVVDLQSLNPGIANPSPQQLAASVTTSDGRGRSFRTRYVYRDARVLPGPVAERRTLGFASVDVIDDQTGQFTRTYYDQRPGYEGTVTGMDAFTRAGLLVSRKRIVSELVEPASGTELVRELSQTASSYELGESAWSFTQRTETAYDEWGNPVLKTQYAEGLAGIEPTVVVSTDFANDPVNWVFGRIREMRTTSGSVTLGWMKNTWHANNITAKSEWLNTTNSWVTTTMTYHSNGNLWTVTAPWAGDGLTRKTTTVYDAAFQAYPWKVTNAVGHETERTYNDDGLVVTSKDANGNITRIDWDVFGRKKKETRPDGGTTEYDYLAYGDPNAQYDEIVTKLDATRSTWRREYFDGTGFKYEVRTSSDCGAYAVVSSEKDYAGRPYRNSQPYCAGSAPVWATTLYDDAGRVQFTNLPDGKNVEYRRYPMYTAEFDQNGLETRKYFDARNRVTKVAKVVKSAGGSRELSTRYGYDPLGRMITATVDPSDVTTVTYDSLNRRTSVTDPKLGTTAYLIDPAGNTTCIISGGKKVDFTYDALNRVTLKQPQGETGVGYTYDKDGIANSIGRLTTVVDAAGTNSYSYEPSGQVKAYTKSIDGSQFTQSFAYDLAGHVTKVTYPDDSYADYSYTAAGNLETISLDGVLFATWSSYDASGKPRNVTYNNGVTTAYQYDYMGRLEGLATRNGATVIQDLTYDWYTRPNSGGMNVGEITDNRDPADKIIAGVNTDETQWYEFDDLYRLTAAHGVWGDKTYSYDDRGNLGVDDGGNPGIFGGLVNRALSYDGQQVKSGTGLADVSYDAGGNMVRKVLDGTSWDYGWTAENELSTVWKNGVLTASMTYDAGGQRVKKVFTPTTGPSVTTTYIANLYEKRTYGDGAPERHTLHLFAHGQLFASVTKSGNIVTASSDKNGWRAEWALGSMYDATTARGAAMKAFHSTRAIGAHPLVRRWFLPTIIVLLALALIVTFAHAIWRGLFSRRFSPALRFAAAGLVLTFGLSACSPSGLGVGRDPLLTGDTTQGPPPGTSFYHRNHINSSTVITDHTGAEVSRMVYLPFGEISQDHSVGADIVTSKFTGKELDEETGLYYYGARYYDPAIGRFISADSIVPSVTDGQAFNRYSYVRNNPIVYVDPTGHAFEFLGNAYRAAENAMGEVGDALGQAWQWTRGKADQFGQYLKSSADYAGVILKSMSTNPLVIASFVIAVALSIAASNPGPMIIWAKASAASVAAQSMALAAGVTDPTALSAIAVVAAAVGAGSSWGQFLKAAGSWALNEGLTRLQGDKAKDFAALNALAIFLIVNGLSRAFGPKAERAALGRDITSQDRVQKALEAGKAKLAEAGIDVDITKVMVREGGFMQVFPAEGFTPTNTIFLRIGAGGADFQGLIAHELVHAAQWQANGLSFWGEYLWQQMTVGYEHNRFEVQACAVSGYC